MAPQLSEDELIQIRKLRKEYKQCVPDARNRICRAIRLLAEDEFTVEELSRIFRWGKKSIEAVLKDV